MTGGHEYGITRLEALVDADDEYENAACQDHD